MLNLALIARTVDVAYCHHVYVPPVHILKTFINFRETRYEHFVAGAIYNSVKFLILTITRKKHGVRAQW